MWDAILAEKKGKTMSEPLWTELEKVDVLRERMGIGYEEARAALNSAQGDVLKALEDLERAQDGKGEDFDVVGRGKKIWNCMRSKLGGLSHTTISLKKHNDTIVTVSAPLGLALVYTVWRKPGLRMLAIAGAIGAAMKHYELEVSSDDKYSYNDEAFNFTADQAGEEF